MRALLSATGSAAAGVSVFKLELGATVRASGLAGLFDRKVYPRMGIPQHHVRRGTAERQVGALDRITPLCVRRLAGPVFFGRFVHDQPDRVGNPCILAYRPRNLCRPGVERDTLAVRAPVRRRIETSPPDPGNG